MKILSKVTVFVLLFAVCASFTSSQANASDPPITTKTLPTQFITVGEATYLTVNDMFTVAPGHSAVIKNVTNSNLAALSVTNATYQVNLSGFIEDFSTVSVAAQDDLGSTAICTFTVVMSLPPVITHTASEKSVEVGGRMEFDFTPYFDIPSGAGINYQLVNLDSQTFDYGFLDSGTNRLTAWGKENLGDYHLVINKYHLAVLKEKLFLTVHVVPTLIAKGRPLSAYGFTPGKYFLVPEDKVPSPSVDPGINATFTEAYFESKSEAVLTQTGSLPAALDIRSPLKSGVYVVINKTELMYSLDWQIRKFNFRVVDSFPPDSRTGIVDIVKYLNSVTSNATDLTGDGVFDFTDISALLQLVEGNEGVRVLPFITPLLT